MVSRLLPSLLSGLLLVACGTAPAIWDRPGTDAAQRDRDAVSCLRLAGRVVPERPRLTTSPMTRLASASCGPDCSDPGGELFDYDTNAARREQTMAACMTSRGYVLTRR